MALSVFLLEPGEDADRAAEMIKLKHIEMLNCGCQVSAFRTLKPQIVISGISIYLAPLHHHAGTI